MSLRHVAHFDKCIIDRLASVGSIDDAQGNSFVRQLVAASLENASIRAAATAQMLSADDLVYAYQTVVRELYPDIFISHGFVPILSASMPFSDAQHFPGFAAVLGAGISVSDEPELRREAIARNAVLFCRQLWQQAATQGKAKDKEWAFRYAKGRSELPQGKGCLGVLVFGVLIGATVVTGILKLA